MKEFDRIGALQSHKKIIQAKSERMKQLLQTIDKTIGHLKGEKAMKEEEMYRGFITIGGCPNFFTSSGQNPLPERRNAEHSMLL